MPTTLYVIRHGATEANLQRPYLLQGQRSNPPLASQGIRQAEMTRDLLAVHAIQHVYSSPMKRAVQTARLIAGPHMLPVRTAPALTECDIGRWEGLSWEAVRAQERDAFERFHSDPARFGYPDGESFADVADRVLPAFDALVREHPNESVLVVSHHVVTRVFLSSVLGLQPGEARRVHLDNCGVSIVVQEGTKRRLTTLNATLHLRGASAAA